MATQPPRFKPTDPFPRVRVTHGTAGTGFPVQNRVIETRDEETPPMTMIVYAIVGTMAIAWMGSMATAAAVPIDDAER